MSKPKTWRGFYRTFHKRKRPGAYGCSLNDVIKTRKGTFFALMIKKAPTTKEKLEILKRALEEPLKKLLYAPQE